MASRAEPDASSSRLAAPVPDPDVLHVAIVVAGLGAGGAERVISLIAGRWAARGYRVTIVAFDSADDPVFHAFDHRIRIVRLGVGAASGRRAALLATFRRYSAVRRSLDGLAPDIVISFLTKINVLTLIASLGTGRPVIISERNNPRVQAANRMWTALLSCLHWRADGIVMQTRASLECVRPRQRKRARVIPNPILIGPLVRSARSPRVLAAVGRLTWQKGFDLLIAAYGLIADRHPDWILAIWGEGDARAALEQQVREAGLEDRISMPGNSASPEGWAGQADAFVLSSRYEGFSNALGEAMAAGLPVVAFDCDYGPAEMIRPGVDGLLVPRGDIAALSAALDTVMGEADLRAHLGSAARGAADRLHPSTIIRQWDEAVDEARARRPRFKGARSEPCRESPETRRGSSSRSR